MFNLSFDGPSAGTDLVRTWAFDVQPDNPVRITFTPGSANDRLEGSPANLFASHNPPAGQPLIAELPPPTVQGQTVTYTINVRDVQAGVAVPYPVRLQWEPPP